jgi:MFS transporter, DHA1 family, multidrug resistance protein
MRVLLFVVLFLVSFDMHAQTPLLAPYMLVLGASGAMIGVVLGAYAISNLAGNLIAGPFLDRFPKKWFVAGGLLLAGLILSGQGVVQAPEHFFVLRLILGFLMAFVSPACFAMLGETGQTRAEQGELMAKNGMVLTTAAIVSPAVGSFLAVQFGYGQSFVILGGIMGAAGVFALLVLPGRRAGGGSASVSAANNADNAAVAARLPQMSSLLAVVANPYLYPAFVGGFAVVYAQGVLIYEVPMLIQRSDLSPSVTGILFSLKGLGALAALSQFSLARTSPEQRTLVGLCLMSLLAYGLAIGLDVSLYVMMFLFGICSGLLFPALSTVLMLHVPRELYGSAFSLFSAVTSAGAILSPIVAGLIDNWNHSFFIVFFVTGGAFLLAGLHRLIRQGAATPIDR